METINETTDQECSGRLHEIKRLIVDGMNEIESLIYRVHELEIEGRNLGLKHVSFLDLSEKVDLPPNKIPSFGSIPDHLPTISDFLEVLMEDCKSSDIQHHHLDIFPPQQLTQNEHRMCCDKLETSDLKHSEIFASSMTEKNQMLKKTSPPPLRTEKSILHTLSSTISSSNLFSEEFKKEIQFAAKLDSNVQHSHLKQIPIPNSKVLPVETIPVESTSSLSNSSSQLKNSSSPTTSPSSSPSSKILNFDMNFNNLSQKIDKLLTHTTGFSTIQPLYEPYLFDPDHVFGKDIFGSSFQPQSLSATLTFGGCCFIYFIGACISMLGFWSFISRSYCSFAILCYPLLMYNWCLFQKDIVHMLKFEGNLLMINLWSFVFLSCMATLLKTDPDFWAVLILLFALFFSFFDLCFFDAFPRLIKLIAIRGLITSCLGVLLVNWIALFYNWIGVQDIQYTFFGSINYSALNFASSAIQNMFLFMVQNVYQAIADPSQLVFVSYPVHILSEREKKERLMIRNKELLRKQHQMKGLISGLGLLRNRAQIAKNTLHLSPSLTSDSNSSPSSSSNSFSSSSLSSPPLSTTTSFSNTSSSSFSSSSCSSSKN